MSGSSLIGEEFGAFGTRSGGPTGDLLERSSASTNFKLICSLSMTAMSEWGDSSLALHASSYCRYPLQLATKHGGITFAASSSQHMPSVFFKHRDPRILACFVRIVRASTCIRRILLSSIPLVNVRGCCLLVARGSRPV